jgi:hypothetical protein
MELRQDAAGTVRGEYLLLGAGSYESFPDGHITSAAVVTLPLRLESHVMPFAGTMDNTGRKIAGTINGGSRWNDLAVIHNDAVDNR